MIHENFCFLLKAFVMKLIVLIFSSSFLCGQVPLWMNLPKSTVSLFPVSFFLIVKIVFSIHSKCKD